MQLLLITSERLNPGDTLPSTFELSQARILSSEHDVAILSVNEHPDFISLIKLGVKKILKRKSLLPGFSKLLGDTFRSVKSLLGITSAVEIHTIEGITVYEAHVYPASSGNTFEHGLQYWVSAGLKAFEKYKADSATPQVVHAHGRFLNAGVLAREIQKEYQCPYIYTDHSTWYQRGIVPKSAIPHLKEVLQFASAVTAVSASLLEHIKSFTGELLPGARVCPNVVDPVFEQPLIAKQLNKKFIFINVAALEEKKGLDILIKAFSQSFSGKNNIELWICGEGMLKEELQLLATKSGVKEQVSFLGKKDKQEIKALLQQSNAFVLSSRIETFGVVLIEALSRGLPVIATICGGPEFIVSEECGILVRPDDVEALSAALLKMHTTAGQYASNKLHDDAIAKYGSQAFLNNMNKLYQSAIS